MKYEEIGARLRKLRRDRKMTQADLADVLNVTASTVSLYESGRHSPDLYMLARYGEFFRADMNWIVFGNRLHTGTLYHLSRADRQFLEAWRSLPEEKRKAAALLIGTADQNEF